MRGTSNYRWINNGQVNKYCKINELQWFLDNGWHLGLNDEFKKAVSDSIKGKHFGKCKDPKKEAARKQKISVALKGNTNWMHNKTRGKYIFKKGIYKGLQCDSSWELAFAVYHIEHEKHIERYKGYYEYVIDGEIHRYIPDFITDDGIFEIKGRKDKKSLEKEKQFPEITIIDKNSITKYLDYVIEKYGKEFYDVLYEDKTIYKNKRLQQIEEQKSLKLQEKQIETEKRNNIRKDILADACKNSEIDFTRYGWSGKLKQYLSKNNILVDKQILRMLRKYYPEFFDIYKPFLRK